MKIRTKKLLASLLTAVIATSTVVCALVACDQQKTEVSNKTETQGGLVVQEQESHGISLCSTPIAVEDYATYGVSDEAIDAKLIDLTITPSYATTKDLEFTMSWHEVTYSSTNSDYWQGVFKLEKGTTQNTEDLHARYETWANSVSCTDYVKVEQLTSDESKLVVSLLDSEYAFPIDLTVAVKDTELSGSVKISYQLRMVYGDFSQRGGFFDEYSYWSGGFVDTYDSTKHARLMETVRVSSFSNNGFIGEFQVDTVIVGGYTYPAFSSVSDLTRESGYWYPTTNWIEVLEENGIQVSTYEFDLSLSFKSLLTLIVAPVYGSYSNLCKMTTDQIVAECGDILALYLETGTNMPTCVTYLEFDYSYSSDIMMKFLCVDPSSITIPATEMALSTTSIIF